MLSSVVLFAINALLIRGLHMHAPAADGWVASLFRGGVGMGVVLAMFGWGRGLELSHLFTRPLVVIRGLLGGFGILAFYTTVVHLGAGRAVIINLSYPMFGSLFAALWLKEHLPLRSWLWMIAGFIGLVTFLGSDFDGRIHGYDLLALAGAVAAGGVVTMIRLLRDREHTSTIYASQCLASFVFALWPAAAPTFTLSPAVFTLMAIAAIIVAIAQLAMTYSYRTLSVARGSSMQMLLPLLTATGGYLLFDETFTFYGVAGAILTLFATWQVVRRPKASPRLASTRHPA
ncbi:MAG: DMT family transporter [Verrucomicrobiales bacterium]